MLLNKNWNTLIKPANLASEHQSNPQCSGKFIAEPLERGYGLTIGNALRRVMLSSLCGAAVTAIRIPGALHEFSAISGVREDLVDIVLNVKGIAVKMHSSEKRTIRIKAEGPCVVVAGMAEIGHDIEILNPNHAICTLAKGSEFEMELIVEVGRGYMPAVNLRDRDMPIGTIPIDALYSPVKRVAYKVENSRVGQVTDYDKLVMTVETDGTITPEMALALAARILQDQLQMFISFEEVEDEKQDKVEELPFSPVLLKKIVELELSVRSTNCLKNANIVYIGDLVIISEAEMLRTQNFGRKSLNEIKAILATYGLTFGMDIPKWPPENLEQLAKKYEDPN